MILYGTELAAEKLGVSLCEAPAVAAVQRAQEVLEANEEAVQAAPRRASIRE